MHDVRYALRQSLRRPGLSAAIIVMLAVGIGATTAICLNHRNRRRTRRPKRRAFGQTRRRPALDLVSTLCEVRGERV